MAAVFRNNIFIAPEENMFILSPQAGKKEIFLIFHEGVVPCVSSFLFWRIDVMRG